MSQISSSEQQQRNKSPGPKEIKPPCLLAPAKILRVRGRLARRRRETPRCAHGRAPVGARRARPSRKAVEKASTKPGKRRRLESQPKLKTKSEAKASLTAVAKEIIYIYARFPFGDIRTCGVRAASCLCLPRVPGRENRNAFRTALPLRKQNVWGVERVRPKCLRSAGTLTSKNILK